MTNIDPNRPVTGPVTIAIETASELPLADMPVAGESHPQPSLADDGPADELPKQPLMRPSLAHRIFRARLLSSTAIARVQAKTGMAP